MTPSVTVRIAAGIPALVCWLGLILQLIVTTRMVRAQGGGYGDALWSYLAYFTVLTNLFMAKVATHALVWPTSRRLLGAPAMELGVVVSMLLVGVTYSLVLRQLWDPQGLHKVADALLHDVAPILALLFWLSRPHGALRWRDAWLTLIWPGAYVAYAMVRGHFEGLYAYPFLDPTKGGYATVARNAVGLSVLVLAAAFALVALDRRLGRRRSVA